MIYTVDRYRDGQKMAEGARVEAGSEEEAKAKAARLFFDCPTDTFVVRIGPRDPEAASKAAYAREFDRRSGEGS